MQVKFVSVIDGVLSAIHFSAHCPDYRIIFIVSRIMVACLERKMMAQTSFPAQIIKVASSSNDCEKRSIIHGI